MSPLPNYTFLPWLRQGIANQITAQDNGANVQVRATIPVQLQLSAQALSGSIPPVAISRNVELYGPGDVVGIERRAIIRTEPHNWITNFEPNYLAFIEFYDEDFPWRYTPAAPNPNSRLRPWITLIVLEEETEFKEGANIKDKPLPYIEVQNANVFPSAGDLWAWAHVHVNGNLTSSDSEITSDATDAVLTRLQNTLNENRDLAYSRLMCPRKLKENTPYHAFVIPTFETGRLAGLKLDPTPTPNATHCAWDPYNGKADATFYPYYHRWYFRTGTVGDFEYLVRLIEFKPVDPSVGHRDMDVLYPGANLPPIGDPHIGGILKLGGALRPPEYNGEFDQWDDPPNPSPHPFQQELAKLINLSDDYSKKTAQKAHQDAGVVPVAPPEPDEPDDPLITPPLYGRWHALTSRLLYERDGSPTPNHQNWLHELNLDPRYRVPAGFGTRIIQANQEAYMDAAWEQIGAVLEANRRIRLAQLAKEVGWIWHERHLKPLHKDRLDKSFLLTAPVLRRVVTGGFTLQHQFSESLLPPSLAGTAMRRALRPGGRLMRVVKFEGTIRPDNLLARVAAGEILATPLKPVPAGLPSPEAISDILADTVFGDIPPLLLDLLRRYPWLIYVPLALIAVVALLALILSFTIVCIPIGAVIIYGLYRVYQYLSRVARALEGADSIRPDHQTPQAIERMPRSPDFVLSDPASPTTPTTGTSDSVEALRFKESLKDAATLLQGAIEAGKLPPLKPVHLMEVASAVVGALDSQVVVPKRTLGALVIPDRIKQMQAGPPEEFREAMAYPEFDIPMYRPLVDISSELFLPNIEKIKQNTATLLETNQKFIEAYLVGLNHEFGRELLWREYPTDQRGSYFRQFWDVRGYLDIQNLDHDALREKLRDIPPLHRWSNISMLGDHDYRQQGGTARDELVLVIRAELLKKYPTAVIYAHRARWQMKDGQIDKESERQLEPLPAEEEANPPRTKIKTPLYEAKVEPDIYFFGFDLTEDEAKGGTGDNPTDDPGWFFVIKERPGEPRFGLDIGEPQDIYVWNDLGWENVLPGGPGGFMTPDHTFTLTDPTGVPGMDEKEIQYKDDIKVNWNPNINSGELAYILYQTPVLVAVHASEMLRSA
jgi:hypothetical protein